MTVSRTPAVGPETRFRRPAGSDATEPPEAHGVARDAVKLLVVRPGGVSHARFADLGDFLRPGDLLVVNNSATMLAAVDGRRAGQLIAVHFSMARAEKVWVVELRPADARGHLTDIRPGERIDMPGGAAVVIGSSYPEPGVEGARLWTARVIIEGDVGSYLGRHGRPIRYSYVPRQWPLRYYQTVFARHAGSAEMPSAGRPFSTELVTALVSAGIAIAPITLHTGVSSAEAGEPPTPEPFAVPAASARMVNSAHAAGSRVIAVGTTVTRALESAADAGGVAACELAVDLGVGLYPHLRAAADLPEDPGGDPGGEHAVTDDHRRRYRAAGRDHGMTAHDRAVEHGGSVAHQRLVADDRAVHDA